MTLRLSRPFTIGALVALIVATLTRSTYPLLHGRFFAEEGYVHFQRMEQKPSIRNLGYINLHVGYWNFFSDLGTWLATHVALTRVPLVTGWLSWVLIVALLSAALFLPSELLPTRFTQVVAAALLVVGTVAVPEVWLNTINAQTYLGLFALLVLFVEFDRMPRWAFALVVVGLGIAAVSGPYATVLAPLFVVQLVRRRSRRQAIVTGVIVIAALVQFVALASAHASGHLDQTRVQFPGFGVMTRDVGAGHVSMFVFGGGLAERLHAHAYSTEGLAAFGLLAAIVLGGLVVALLNVPQLHVSALLGAAFVIEELLVNFGNIHNSAGGRYSVVPIGVLTLALVHATTARSPKLATVAAVLCGVVLVSGLLNFWSYHPRVLRCLDCPQWSRQVERYEQGGPNRLFIWPYPRPRWHVTLPVARARSNATP